MGGLVSVVAKFSDFMTESGLVAALPPFLQVPLCLISGISSGFKAIRTLKHVKREGLRSAFIAGNFNAWLGSTFPEGSPGAAHANTIRSGIETFQQCLETGVVRLPEDGGAIGAFMRRMAKSTQTLTKMWIDEKCGVEHPEMGTPEYDVWAEQNPELHEAQQAQAQFGGFRDSLRQLLASTDQMIRESQSQRVVQEGLREVAIQAEAQATPAAVNTVQSPILSDDFV